MVSPGSNIITTCFNCLRHVGVTIMVGASLRRHIQEYAIYLRESSPLFYNARRGRLGPAEVRRYLMDMHFLVQKTPPHLTLAKQQAEARGWHELAEHFSHRLGEEVGHDEWSRRDLVQLASRDKAPEESLRPSPQVRALAARIEETIQRDPRLYLSYILLAEYLTVLCGEEWIELLEKDCGIERSHLSVIGNHAVLDRDHAHEGFETVDRLVPPSMENEMLTALKGFMSLHQQICEQAGEVAA